MILISLVSVNEALSDSLIRQGYDADGNLLGYVCNQFGQCQWVLLEPAPKHYSPPPKSYSSPQPKYNNPYDPASDPRLCNICEACMFGNKTACFMLAGIDCGRCKKVSESDNRNIDRMGTDTRCSLIKMPCESACGTLMSEYAREQCRKKCESDYEKCIDKMK